MTFPPEVWDGALRRLKGELPPFSMEAWLEPLTAVPQKNGLRLLCPSPFHRDRVRDHFLPRILECLRAEVGEHVAVELALWSDSGTPEHNGQPASMPAVPNANKIKIHPPTRKPGALVRAPRMIRPRPSGPDNAEPPTRADDDPAGEGKGEARDDTDPGDLGTRVQQPGPRRALSAPSRTTAGGHAHRAQSQSKSAGASEAILRERIFPYTFDNFIVGPCNALAREASLAIARDQQLSLNQVYLTSQPGNGKTHLSRAAVVEAKRLLGERARYTSAESFTSEFLTALRTSQMQRFKRKYRRDCDVLVIEDIQFLEGKTSTQLEFFHTVRHMLDSGGRVLLTSDRLPQALVNLDDRIRSQLSSGLLAELEPPDAQVRRNILRAKAAGGGVRLPEDCLDLLVDEVRGSVRDLEGVLIQIVTTASLLKRLIDIDLTREAVRKKVGISKPADREVLDPAVVIRVVASFFKTTPEAMASRSRRRDHLVPRQLAMYLSRRYTDASLAEIGRLLGRDHPAVRNAISKLERAILEKAPLRYQVESLCERLDELAGGRRSV
jgi:chromosomal replication initiator protein